jgi:hypothetical protein
LSASISNYADHLEQGFKTASYVFRDFPIESMHAQAPKAAEAAHCAGEQDK